MLTKERIVYLLDKLEENKVLYVKEIAQELKVSESTIRRDLKDLELQGKLKRVHGGAVQPNSHHILTNNKETDIFQHLEVNFHEKVKICKEASKKVKDGDCVFIDGGTTLAPLISFLQYRPITIVTFNYLAIAQLKKPLAQVIVIGGEYLSRFAMATGSMTQNELSQFQFDHAFIGCSGIEETLGIAYTPDLASRELKIIAINNAQRKYLLIDQSKINVRGLCKFTPLSTFDSIITGSGELVYLHDDEYVVLEKEEMDEAEDEQNALVSA